MTTKKSPDIMTRVTRNPTEADDSPGPVVQIETPSAGEAIIKPDEIPAGADMDSLLRDLDFYEEPVTIMLHPWTNEKESTQMFSVGVNGVKQYLFANKVQTVKRKFVAQLLKARPDYVGHQEGSVDGRTANTLTKFSMSKYNFDVIQDTPRGRAWLAELRTRYAPRSARLSR